MYNQFDIGPKKIEGYEYVSGPDMKAYSNIFIIDTEGDDKLGLDGKPGRDDEFVFKYKKVTNKPGTNPNTPNGEGSNNHGSVNGQPGQSQSGTGQNGLSSNKPNQQNKPVKTGDTTPILPITAAAVVSLAGIVFVLSKKRR